MKRLAALVLATALAASSASAQVLLNDNFNGENGGFTYLNYAGFANWLVTGQVDLVKSGDFGITCPIGGSCVDLDGSSGPGQMYSSQNFGFASGDIMKISFDVSGNQRSGGSDMFFMGLGFTGGSQLGAYLGTGGFSSFSGANLAPGYTAQTSIADNAPFSTWTFQFQALNTGAFQLNFGTTSGDNVGPLLDNVMVERISGTTVTPEPSTWAMLAFGLGSVGFVSRRRRVRKA